MAVKNIQMNMLNENDSYDVLYPESDYNLLLNKPNIPDISTLNGLKMEKGSRIGTGILECNGNWVILAHLTTIIQPMMFYYARSYLFSSYYIVKLVYNDKSGVQKTNYTPSLSYERMPLVWFNQGNSPSNITTYKKSFSYFCEFEDIFTLLDFDFDSNSNIKMIGGVGGNLESHTYTKTEFNNNNSTYYWWCLGY